MIAVLTDFGAESFYAGVIRAVLHHAVPRVPVVDITHSVAPHDVAQGSFILDTVCDFYPDRTVFLAVVDPGVGGVRRNLVVEAGGRWFVGPDNGLLWEIIARNRGAAVFTIDEAGVESYRMAAGAGRTFLGRDVFAPAAAALADGLGPDDIGDPAGGEPVRLPVPAVQVKPGCVRATARYVDPFGNVLFAITRSHLERAFTDTDITELVAETGGRSLGNLARYYGEREDGSLMAVLNSWDRVEIAVPGGRAIDGFADRRLSGIEIEIRKSG